MNRAIVIVVNYRGTEDTAICLRSIFACNPMQNVVLVDNTPHDPELLPLIEKYSRVHLVSAHKNLGFGRGNNLGIKWALKNTDCEFVFLLNNDAGVLKDTIERLEKALDDHPAAGISVPKILLAEDQTKLWYGGGDVDWKRGSARVPGFFGSGDAKLAITPRYVSFASGCAMLLRRILLEKEIGFDPRFFMYEEDLELSLRVQEKGWRIWYEPLAVVLHKGQGSQENRKTFLGAFDPGNPNLAFFAYHKTKNRLLNMEMHAKGKNRLSYKIVYPLFLLAKCLQWGFHGRCDALRSVVKGISDYRKERKMVVERDAV